MAQRIHTHTGRTAGTPIGTEEYTSPLGDAAGRNYVSRGGNIVARFGETTAGAEFVSSTSVNDAAPAPAGLALTIAARIRLVRGGGAYEIITPRNSTGKQGSVVLTAANALTFRAGGDVVVGVSNAVTMTVGTEYIIVYAAQAGTTTTNGKTWGTLLDAAGTTTLYETPEKLDANNGTTNIITETIGKILGGTTTAPGTIDFDDVVFENAYNKALRPAATAAVVAEDNVTWRVIDLTGSTGVTSLSNASASPTVTGLTIDGLRIRFVENPTRTTSVTVTYTVNTASGSTARTTVVPPPTGGTPPRHGGEFVYRGGQLIPFDGAPAWTGATGTIALGAPGIPSVEPAWSDDFTTLDVATSTTTATAKWLPVDTWQNIDRGYRDFAGTSWNLNPNEVLGGAKRSAFTVGPDGLTIKAIRTPDAWKPDIVASMTAQGQSPFVAPAWSGGVLISNKIVKRFRYGYIAVKAQLPTPGRGMFPALWLYAADGSNNAEGKGAAEIDLFEVFGHPAGTPWSITTHYRDNTNAVVRPSVDVTTQATDTTGWHVYGVDWQPTYLRFYKDGTQVAELTGDDAAWFNTDMALRLNYAMDASWFTTPSDTSTPDELPMNIRWVAQWPSLA